MSDEMAVGDNASQEDNKVISEETETEAMDTASVSEPVVDASVNEEPIPKSNEDQPEEPEKPEIKVEIAESDEPLEEKLELEVEVPKQEETMVEQTYPATEAVRGVKRRASAAFSDGDAEDFKGFDGTEKSDLADYRRIIERLEAEVSAAVNTHTPIRAVMASPAARLSKRARQDTGGYRAEKWSEHLEAEVSAAVRSFADEEPGVRPAKRQRQPTDGSRPSSALSSRSDGEGALSTDASSSPATRGRRATIEISSPLLRIPLERGWRRELVYRASAPAAGHDATARRQADIYYYTPAGKKLRSTREVGEHLSGTGLTLENFSFFKEPLGIDDPEKEIIRDAKVMRRVESPVPAAPPPAIVDGKRTPKPKPPKGASPEPVTPKSPPARIKVKSMGSRLSSNGTSTPKPIKKPQAPAPAPADNNNTAAWKKPKGPLRHPHHHPVPSQHPQHPPAVGAGMQLAVAQERADVIHHQPRQSQQPCSMACGRGAVPSLACAACLCLYHPACAGVAGATPERFLCKNCRKPSPSPPLDTPLHKGSQSAIPSSASGANLSRRLPVPVPVPVPIPVPVPVPVPAKIPRNDKRVLLRMKVAGGGPDGERVWAVAKPHTAPTAPAPCRPALPQSLAVVNGRRFIVVSRATNQ